MDKKLKILALSLLLGIISGFSQSSSMAGSRPNIILVLTDDQGMGDLSCMGNEILRTPHIDEFYEKSTRFTDFHVSPTCAPTRAALMSGRVPFKNGVTHTILQRERMALDVFTLPQALKTSGYTTGLFGKWHLGDELAYLPVNRGFDEVLMHGAGGIGQLKYGDFPPNAGENSYFDNVLLHNDTIVQTKGFCTDLFFNASLAWIKKQHQANKPYFAYVSLNAPHGPFNNNAPEEYQKRFLDAGYDKKTAVRYGMIENIDDNFGEMMAKLEAWGALDNTIVIFMTDNGMSMPPITHNGEKEYPFNAGLKGRKNTPHEGGTHVPFFVQWKGVLGQGVDIDGLASHIDLYQTFCELAGVNLPKSIQKMDGRSFVPLLENPNAPWEDRNLFFHCGRWAAGEREQAKYIKCAVRTEQWRFVNNSQLYDISKDPFEEQDVSANNPKVIEQFREVYDRWWASTLPFMVNEDLPSVEPEDQPLVKRYYEQLEKYGIPDWAPESIK
ncbi:MAG: arylsulfatase [Muricauda sp.]|nr:MULTISPECIES: arylsulfatase [unclassified Allomuricauda]MAU17014.1 arylsulfatase [Allomuricauda sp.]|tara:strand:+ start:3680 stop:5170 length:1491 start_codon:yes stop_codon:yes gene_type:complete